jgi:hypothetical protein
VRNRIPQTFPGLADLKTCLQGSGKMTALDNAITLAFRRKMFRSMAHPSLDDLINEYLRRRGSRRYSDCADTGHGAFAAIACNVFGFSPTPPNSNTTHGTPRREDRAATNHQSPSFTVPNLTVDPQPVLAKANALQTVQPTHIAASQSVAMPIVPHVAHEAIDPLTVPIVVQVETQRLQTAQPKIDVSDTPLPRQSRIVHVREHSFARRVADIAKQSGIASPILA